MALLLRSSFGLNAGLVLLFAGAGCSGGPDEVEVESSSNALCATPNPPVPFTSVTLNGSCSQSEDCYVQANAPAGVVAVRIVQPADINKVRFIGGIVDCPGGHCSCSSRVVRGRLWRRNSNTGCWSYMSEVSTSGQYHYGVCGVREMGWTMPDPLDFPYDEAVVQIVEDWGRPVEHTFTVRVVHYYYDGGVPP